MARRRRNSNVGTGLLFLLLIFFLILKKIFNFLKPYLIGIGKFITSSFFINNFIITIGIIGLITIIVIIVINIINFLIDKHEKKKEAERKRLANIKAEEGRKAEEERRKLAAIEAEKRRKIEAKKAEEERLRIEEEKRLAAIKKEKERQKVIEAERLRLEREYQYGYRDDMTGFEYEEYCADLFRCFNWKTEVTKKSGDFGVDVIAKKKGITIVAQCKKYTKQKVGFDAVKEAFTAKALNNADFAIVITNSEFAKSAIKGAEGTHVKLLRHPDLGDWLIKLFPEDEQLKVKKKNIKTIKDWIKYYNVKLLPYEDVFKMIRGDDYDLYKETFKLWKKTKKDSDEWMFSFINELDDVFSFTDKKSFDVKELNEASEKINKLLPIENIDIEKEKKIITFQKWVESSNDIISPKSKITLTEWKERYGEQLAPFVESLKITEGQNFDLYKESYDAWTKVHLPDIKADEWMNMLVESIKKTYNELEEKYGPVKDFTDEIIDQIIEDEKNSLNRN